ncbi:MAG TPA: cobalamin-binding protein [Elusimicrobia bacterium]|nr:MAG: hypothetical protein A2X37_04935 [Elusimicrobia bacterium GWA2_66_18]OGR76900.1 MAG: hypothetical protein A2X40_03875 [Elusimicrobia bacterium GWC2_65_9]HBL17092.1 cobalamin-binding protein [Elusimicrobiota bacterium]
MEILASIVQSLEEGDEETVSELTREALGQGLKARDILDKGLIAGMNAVGVKFREHEVFLPDVLLSAKAMNAGMKHLKPHFAKEGVPNIGKVVLGTVHGDLHDIGKNLVSIMLKGAGFDVVDLGKDIIPEAFVDAAVREEAGFLGLSALLTTTMPVMKDVVDLVKKRGLSGKLRVIVGGAPVSEDYARQIGADLYAFDAASAVDRLKAAVGR